MRNILLIICFIIVMYLISAPSLVQAAETKVGIWQMPYEGNVTSAIYELSTEYIALISLRWG